MQNSASEFSFADVPGYVEAVKKEQHIRGIACLGINETICGFEVKPLTAAHIALLSLVDYPFHGGFNLETLVGTKEKNFTNGKPGLAGDIMLFLWIVSPMYQSGIRGRKHWWQRRTARDKFNEAFSPVLKLPVDSVVREILQYVEEAYVDADMPDQTGIEKIGWAFQISIAVELSTHHGYRVDFWNPDCPPDKNPLHVPLKIITQLRKYRQFCEGGQVMNRSDKLLDAALKRN